MTVTIADYEKHIEETFERVRQLGKHKGREYAGTADRLANFKRNAEACGITMEQCWCVYAGKHWDAISQFIKDDAAGIDDVVRMEPLRSRVHDLIVYLLLFEAMLIESDPSTALFKTITATAAKTPERPGVGGFDQLEHLQRQVVETTLQGD